MKEKTWNEVRQDFINKTHPVSERKVIKNWDYYKDKFIEQEVQLNLSWLRSIEERTQSPIECITLMHLEESFGKTSPNKIGIYPQFKIGKYTVDFLITNVTENTRFVIECDGHEFHEKTKGQVAHDKERDRYLIKEGFTILHYSGSEICDNPEIIVRDLNELIFKFEVV